MDTYEELAILCFVREDVEVIKRKDLMSPAISTIWLEYKPTNGKQDKKVCKSTAVQCTHCFS